MNAYGVYIWTDLRSRLFKMLARAAIVPLSQETSRSTYSIIIAAGLDFRRRVTVKDVAVPVQAQIPCESITVLNISLPVKPADFVPHVLKTTDRLGSVPINSCSATILCHIPTLLPIVRTMPPAPLCSSWLQHCFRPNFSIAKLKRVNGVIKRLSRSSAGLTS